MVGLVKAARSWQQRASFPVYATGGINFQICNFIRDWEDLVNLKPSNDDERDFFEWSVWPYMAPFETWTSLEATPEELVITFEEFEAKREALVAAMLSLPKRSRQMVNARFSRAPPQTFQSIAREHQISYAQTVRVIKRALYTLKEVIENFENHRSAATPIAMRG